MSDNNPDKHVAPQCPSPLLQHRLALDSSSLYSSLVFVLLCRRYVLCSVSHRHLQAPRHRSSRPCSRWTPHGHLPTTSSSLPPPKTGTSLLWMASLMVGPRTLGNLKTWGASLGRREPQESRPGSLAPNCCQRPRHRIWRASRRTLGISMIRHVRAPP